MQLYIARGFNIYDIERRHANGIREVTRQPMCTCKTFGMCTNLCVNFSLAGIINTQAHSSKKRFTLD